VATAYGRVLLLKLVAAALAGGLARSRPELALSAGAAALLLAALL
jgi:hypothetical protein